MNQFQRKFLLEPFKNLAALEARDNWWKEMLCSWNPSGRSGGLRMAVRANRLNFYIEGQSVAMIGIDSKKRPYASVHAKYVAPRRSAGKLYLRFDCDGRCLTADFSDICFEPGITLSSWINEARTKVGSEKKFIDTIVSQTPSIIDLEMGLPSFDGKSGAPRVDVVNLEKTSSGPQICFWEIKLLRDSRLVSRTIPEVTEQVKRYKAFFEDENRRARVTEGYVNTCHIIKELLQLAERLKPQGRKLAQVVQDVLDKPEAVRIDPAPRILIYRDRESTASWSSHLRRLRNDFGLTCFEVTEPCDLASLSS